MKIEYIKELVSLTVAKVEILKLKANDYAWACHVDDKTKEDLLKTLDEIDSLIASMKDKP